MEPVLSPKPVRRWLLAAALLLTSALLLPSCQSGPTADEIVARMREVESTIDNAHAVVEFDLSLEGLDSEIVVEIWEASPNRFRAEVLSDTSGEFAGLISVTDGHQVWLYHPGENQVVTGPVGEFGVDEPLSPHQLIERMGEAIDFVLDHGDAELVGQETLNGVPTYKLRFTPADGDDGHLPPPLLGTTHLWVEPDRWVVVQAHISGGPVGEGWMHVREYAFNEGVPPDRFRFEVPEGATVRHAQDMQPKHMTIDEALQQAHFRLRVPDHVPEGTTLIDVFETNGRYVQRYDHGDIAFTIVQASPAAQRDLPPGTAREVTLRGQPARLVVDGQGNALVTWSEDDVSITIGGLISEEQLLKVAESLR